MKVSIFVGTGGVGKTSVSAAWGLRTALAGEKCLVLTIDPARRLRTALNIDSTEGPKQVNLREFQAKGELWAEALDVASTLNTAVRLYAKKSQAKQILDHPIYQILIASLVGLQELLAVERLDQAMKEGFENVVIDTAPARHAFEFLDKPQFFFDLVSFPVVRLVGRTYKWVEKSGLSGLGRRTLEFYARVEEILGATLVRQVLDFYSIFRSIAEGYAERADQTIENLRDPEKASFHIVTTPFKAERDAHYFWKELNDRRLSVRSLIVNRVWPAAEGELPPDVPQIDREAVEWYAGLSQAHERMWRNVARRYAGRIKETVAIPELAGDVEGLPALHQIAQRLNQAPTP